MAAAGNNIMISTWSLVEKRPILMRSAASFNLCFINNRPVLPKRRLFTRCAFGNPLYHIKEEGLVENFDYKVFLLDSFGKKISPWHDVPLCLGDSVLNFVVEIPKDTNVRMELATNEHHNPIKQDSRMGKIRCNMKWNYGLLPQTWEDPSFVNPEVDLAFGDNDPVDVVEIGGKCAKIGQVMKVKPLAALALIDEGELDWKIVAISLDDPRASLVHDVDDIENHFPGTLATLSGFFRDYKIDDGKPANKFGLGNKPANKDYALKVINEANESWTKLVKRSLPAGELSLI